MMRPISTPQASLFNEVPREQRHELFNGNAPIRWWYKSELRGKDGDQPFNFTPPGVQIEGGGSLPLGADTKVLSHFNSSVVSTQSIRALRRATIIVDVNRAEGASLDAVAAYAAFVGLAEIQFSPKGAPGSILALFNHAEQVRELTEWDRSFLRELYRLPLDRLARYQRGRLIGAITKGVDEP